MIIAILETIQTLITVVILGCIFVMGTLLMNESYVNKELKQEMIRLKEIIKENNYE